ncbi:hypothetical protein YC2023_007627 [Brassica napus]
MGLDTHDAGLTDLPVWFNRLMDYGFLRVFADFTGFLNTGFFIKLKPDYIWVTEFIGSTVGPDRPFVHGNGCWQWDSRKMLVVSKRKLSDVFLDFGRLLYTRGRSVLRPEVRRISEQQRGGSHFLGCTSFTGHCGAGAVGDIFSV